MALSGDSDLHAGHRQQRHAKDHGLLWQSLGPLMILPAMGSAQTEAMCFFQYISVQHLTEYHPCGSWRKTLMFFAQTVPSVRHAAIALALIHRNYFDRHSSGHVHQSHSLTDWPPNAAPLLHYNQAIHLLLNQQAGDSPETTVITLLACYLFTCFDNLAGNYVQAIKHLRAGVELSRNIDRAINTTNSTTTSDHSAPSGVHPPISQVTRQIRRLDMQAGTFLVDWTPLDIQETCPSPLRPSDRPFRSLDHAADQLQTLLARVMRLRHTEQQMSPTERTTSLSPSSRKDIVLDQLETWSALFENTLQQDSAWATASGPDHPLVSLLRLQHTIACMLLRTCGPGRELDYDSFLPQFQQGVAWAADVAAAHERYAGPLKPTFTPETGIVPVLYIIGVKCRHPVVRRQVLGILRRRPIREAVWDSICAARVVERVIEIEEGGQLAPSMEEISVWQRIETVSWEQSAASLDITYTFCAREGLYIESLRI
ncbi:hypothetical protein ATEIFO6365_0004067600 [Aspergillus terreus]|uniref:Uncharacterized protein n=1 Tax=Aspergillus terreus TaxID=33178 RepID=A0A5M3YQ82_ASPTE|nr:hypothetical protein ATETN484_0002070100 [Aspergillus terreus]GFF15557.1 hypothetical protein ATEIFO6365_0004067600 [Aspergillus terreus]